MVAFSTGIITNIAEDAKSLRESTVLSLTVYPSVLQSTELTINTVPTVRRSTELVLNTFQFNRRVSTPLTMNIFNGAEAFSTELTMNVAPTVRLNTLLKFNVPSVLTHFTSVSFNTATNATPHYTLIGFKILAQTIKKNSTQLILTVRERITTSYTQLVLNISTPGKVYNPIFRSFYEPGDCGCI